MMDALNRSGSTDATKLVQAIQATDGDFVCGPVKFGANHTSRPSP